MKLRRYWIKFETDPYSLGLIWGVGVTGLGIDDALYLIQSKMLKGGEVPPIKEAVEDIDVSTLDRKHILRSMVGNPAARGIWFPPGYD